MGAFWDYIKDIFRSAEESSPSRPLVHELITRTESQAGDYEQWKGMLVCRRLRDWLVHQYAVFSASPDDIDESLDFLHTPSSKGFVIHLHQTGYNTRDAVHFFDFLKERAMEAGYRPQISDRRSYNRPGWVETVERHYLKPVKGLGEAGKYLQQFGNITIELFFRNERPFNLKFRATAYSDRLFEEARDFSELMQVLL